MIRSSWFFCVGVGMMLWSVYAEDRISENVSAERIICDYAQKNCFSGAGALVVGKSGIVSLAFGGVADRKSGRSITLDTLFQLASITKPFTAIAVLQLVEKGRIGLDDPVSKYLPFLKRMSVRQFSRSEIMLTAPAKEEITIRHLLSHTSDMKFIVSAQRMDMSLIPLEAAAMAIADSPLLFEPGTQFSYSNAGFNTLGRVVEVVSGKPLEQYMKENIFNPLGMHDTSFFPDAGQIKRLAVMYVVDKSEKGIVESPLALLSRPLDVPGRFAEAGGGLFSTPRDMAYFAEMLVNRGRFRGQTILSEKMFDMMISVQTPKTEKKYSYGFGFHVRNNCFFHGGAGGSDLKIFKDQPYAFLWFTQQYFCRYAGNGSKAEADVERVMLDSDIENVSQSNRIDRTGN